MATSKRERQKAARREKVERQMRAQQRRRNVRRAVIAVIVAALIIGTGFILFGGSSTPSTTTTTSTTTSTTTTTTPPHFAKVAQPSPAGTFGTAPTVVVPSGAPPSAMEVSDLITGTGAAAKAGDTLTVQYVLATYSSRKVVQSSWTSQPFSFTLGQGQVIPGWDEGMVGMRVGGRREMIIPPALGYKNVAQGPGIAANDTLVFVVDLIKIA